jgi:hypothetical protein
MGEDLRDETDRDRERPHDESVDDDLADTFHAPRDGHRHSLGGKKPACR